MNFDNMADLDFDFDSNMFDFDNKVLKKKVTQISAKRIMYKNAEKLCNDIGIIQPNDKFHIIVNGNFIMGDFLEALVVHNNWDIEELTISSLSLSEGNVDSIANLINGGYVGKLNLLLSDYFFSHEKYKLVRYINSELIEKSDIEVNVSYYRIHTKINLFKLRNGGKIIMDGSANLRSSGNIENINIDCSNSLYNLHKEWIDDIINKYKYEMTEEE